MITDLTQNELLLLAYNELPLHRKVVLETRMDSEQPLQQAYDKLLREIGLLDHVALAPDPTSVQIVLEESCSASPLELI